MILKTSRIIEQTNTNYFHNPTLIIAFIIILIPVWTINIWTSFNHDLCKCIYIDLIPKHLNKFGHRVNNSSVSIRNVILCANIVKWAYKGLALEMEVFWSPLRVLDKEKRINIVIVDFRFKYVWGSIVLLKKGFVNGLVYC